VCTVSCRRAVSRKQGKSYRGTPNPVGGQVGSKMVECGVGVSKLVNVSSSTSTSTSTAWKAARRSCDWSAKHVTVQYQVVLGK